MRKNLPLFGLLLLLVAAPAAAQDTYIGLFTDPSATECDAPYGGVGATLSVEVVAIVPGVSAVSAVEFRVGNLPPNADGGIVSTSWNTALVIGDLENGISLAFSPMLPGPVVHLGTINFYDYSGTWVGDDHMTSVLETLDSGNLVVVDDEFNTFPVLGGQFTFNCTDPDGCNCLPGPGVECLVGTELLDFGSVALGSFSDLVLDVSNPGSVDLSLYIGPDACGAGSAFSVLNAGNHIIGAGGNLDLHVRFEPLAEGPHDCTLDLGNVECPPVELIGEGIAALPACALSDELIDFGPVPLGEDALGYLTISNEGDAPFTVDLPATPCAASPDFQIINDGSVTLQPAEDHIVQFRFFPSAAGSQSCELDLGGNDCPPVTLLGMGIDMQVPEGNHIGLYLDQEAQVCQTPLTDAGQIVYARILAVLPDIDPEGAVTAVEFRLDNLPENLGAPEGTWFVQWNTPLTIGDVEDGIALAWSGGGVPGPIVELGLMTFYSNDTVDWVGDDHVVTAMPSQGGALVYVDQNFDTHPVGGGSFTFNCTDPDGCTCYTAPPPLCHVSDTSLDFGNVAVGQSSLRSFNVHNLGEGTLSGYVAESCDDYEIVSGAGYFGLAQGQYISVQVRFQPMSAGTHTCVIELGTDDCPEVVAEGAGVAPAPICELEPDSLLFGDIVVGATQTQSFNISNIGIGELSGFVSESCAEFTILDGDGSFSIYGGQMHTVIVEFHPTAAGDFECAIELGNEYCDAIPVLGSAHDPAPGCALDPEALDFGDIALGTWVELDASIVNTGDITLNGQVYLASTNFSVVAGDGDFQIEVGESHDITVRYEPITLATHNIVLTTGLEYCAELPLTGTAHEPSPTCDISPASLDFGDVILGDLADLVFTISNDGDGPLNGEVTLLDDHFEALIGAGPFSVDSGSDHLVGVRFEPQTYGPLSAVVELGAEVCADVPVSGFARNPMIGGDHIGLFGDTAGQVCSVDLLSGMPVDLYLLAVVPSFADSGITAWEFRLDGFEQLESYAAVTVEWPFLEVQGDLATGVSYDYGEAVPGEIVQLGVLHVVPLTTPPANLRLTVEQSEDGLQRRVTDHEGLGWDVAGGRFTVNCDDPDLCDCLDFENGICDLSHTSLDFGIVSYGNTAFRDFTIVNVGYGPLEGDLQVSGEYFHLSEGEGPFVLMPGDGMVATAYFQPGGVGEFEGLITTGLADCPEIALTGQGTSGGGGSPFLGLFEDLAATDCDTDLMQFVSSQVYVSVILPAWLPSITAAEFRIEHYPDPSMALVTQNWNTPLVIGTPDWGIALAFDPPLPGPVAVLGTLDFFPLVDFGPDYLMMVEQSNDSGNLVVVGPDYNEYWAHGGLFTFNCSYYYCDCSMATPVTLSSFQAVDLGGSARIDWESDTSGALEFRLFGSRDGFEWSVPYIEAAPGIYRAEDSSAALAQPGEVEYRLFGRLPGEEWLMLRDENLPVEGISYPTRLLAAHPNPFNPKVTVPFSLKDPGRVKVTIYDVAGRQVANLADAHFDRGEHSLVWKGRDDDGHAVGSGVYFVRMETAGFGETHKLVLLR